MIPLAERMRPKTLDDWVGHEDLVSPGKPLYEAIRNDRLFSFLLYAPPGTGKTTLCSLIRHYSKSRFVSISAVTSGVKELKALIEEAQMWKQRQGRESICFIDEIHHFNKSQQDVLLPWIERGELTLIGATTENPSFELNAALLSRMRVLRFERLRESDVLRILKRAVEELKKESSLQVEDEALSVLAREVHGDARAALNLLEQASPEITIDRIRHLLQTKPIYHDKHGDSHYQVISAFIKSMRAGQTDAALYYLARLWMSGEDPLFIARRMVIFASEDIGNADLRALALANAVRHSVEFVGRPECFYALAQGVLYLSEAKKSREAGDRFQKAQKLVETYGGAAVPEFLINPQSKLDRDLGRGRPRKENESFLPKDVSDSNEHP